jgi:hypothetical protein
MSLPGFYWWQLDWENEDGESKASTSPPKTIEIPPNKQVRAHAMLAAVGSQNKHQGFGANCYISRYVQNGVVHDVTARLVDGTNITEIDLTLDVWQGSATGIVYVEVG